MRKHIVPIFLLILAVISFFTSYYAGDELKGYCNISAFLLPTIAALLEIIISVKSDRNTEEKISDLEDNQITLHYEDETLFIRKNE